MLYCLVHLCSDMAKLLRAASKSKGVEGPHVGLMGSVVCKRLCLQATDAVKPTCGPPSHFDSEAALRALHISAADSETPNISPVETSWVCSGCYASEQYHSGSIWNNGQPGRT